MDFFQCLVAVVGVAAWSLATTRDSGSLCSGAGQAGAGGGDTEQKLDREAVEPGDTVDTSSESATRGHGFSIG